MSHSRRIKHNKVNRSLLKRLTRMAALNPFSSISHAKRNRFKLASVRAEWDKQDQRVRLMILGLLPDNNI